MPRTRHLLLALVAVVAIGVAYWQFFATPYAAGQAKAKEDIANGRLAIRHTGYIHAEYWDERLALKERHGIDWDNVCGCIMTSEIQDHTAGYNDIMTAEIETRFGPGSLRKMFDDVKTLVKNKRAKVANGGGKV